MKLLFTFAIVLVFQLANAQTPPSKLFHWATASRLRAWAEVIEHNKRLVFMPLDSNQTSLVMGAHPEFIGKTGIFSWINLVTGMGAITLGSHEFYANKDPETGEPPRLIVSTINPRARVAVVESYVDFIQATLAPGNLRNERVARDEVDLVLHRVYSASDNNNLKIQEWIILNPNIIDHITADPNETANLIKNEIQKMSTPGFLYSPEELHLVSDGGEYFSNRIPMRQKRIIPILEEVISAGTDGIPHPFLSSTSNKSNGCISRVKKVKRPTTSDWVS